MASEERKVGDMLDYLPAGEEIIGEHTVGDYDIVTTTERVICQRKFPRLFVEVHYSDISNLEHHTTILWNELINGLALLVVSGFIYFSNRGGEFVDPLNNTLKKYVPELLTIFSADLIIMLVVFLAAGAGLYRLAVRFMPSLKGYFRIARKDRAPVIIPTGMTPELRGLIREIDELIKRKEQENSKYAAQPQQQMQQQPAEEVKMGAESIREALNLQLADLSDNKVILISSKSENHSQVVSNMLDIMVNKKGMGGVYLSITRPYEFILSTINEAGIPSNDILFIDCISMMAGKAQHKKADNVIFVENPSSLEEVSMYLDKSLSKVKSPRKFLFLDSLSSLLIYNTDKSVREFTHFIINKIRLENIAGIILSIEKKEAEDLVKTLTPMCDMELKF